MFHLKKIYCGFDVNKFCQIKDFLEKEGIEKKVKISNPVQERLHKNILLGGNPLVLNTLGVNSEQAEYTIWVDKANVERVEDFLRNLCD